MNNTDIKDVSQSAVIKRQKLDKNVILNNVTNNSNNNDDDEMIKKYGVGAKLLSRMGYKIGHGLGSEGKGISKPIEAFKRPHGKAGLGMLSDLSNYQDDDLEYDNGYSSSSSSSFSSSIISETSIPFNENRVSNTLTSLYEKSKKNKKSSKKKKIIFNKKGSVTLNNMERLKLISRLKDLEINHPSIIIPYTLLDNLKTKTVISRESRIQIVDIVQKLENIEIQLESLSDRIANLNVQHKVLDVSSSILSDIAQHLSVKDPDVFLVQVPECIEKILQIENDDIMDILMSRFLRHLFNIQKNCVDDDQEITCNNNDKTDSKFWILTNTPFQKYFLPIVDILQYRIDENKFLKKKLNRSQTVIFQNVYPSIIELIKSTKLRSTIDFDTLVATLIDYEQLLKYLDCYDYLLENVLMPKIEDIIYDDWELNDDSINLNWLLNTLILLPDEKIKDIKEMVKNKFEDHCYHWYYRDSIISQQNLLIIKQILDSDDQFYKIIRKILLPKFVKLVDKYFDLEYDMAHLGNSNYTNSDNMEEVQDNFDSIYVFKFIRDHRYIFYPNDYEVFILSFFNLINKFIFDWCFYYKYDQLLVQKAEHWFNWLINKVFSGSTKINTPSQLEISQIKRSKEFLSKFTNHSHNNDNGHDCYGDDNNVDTVEIIPIHDETFNLLDSLESINGETNKNTKHVDCDGEEYKVVSLPIRKVTVTFKEVVEDYCVEKGYILQKLNNRYTDISFNSTNCVLMPIYEVRNGSRYKNIAIKDDILWVEDDKGRYTPTYLHELHI